MADYFFNTITPTQALFYVSLSDTLIFTGDTVANGLIVVFNAGIWISDPDTGRTVQFSSFMGNEANFVFPSGPNLVVGSFDGFEAPLNGGAGEDVLYGGPGASVLKGNGGADTLVGGEGGDTLSGGAGTNLFVEHPGDSPAAAATAVGQGDTIQDWSNTDYLSFSIAAGTASNYAEILSESSASALASANSLIASGVIDYVAVQVGANVEVFADSKGDNGTADDMVLLTNRNLGEIDFTRILASGFEPPLSPPPLPPGPVSPPPVSPPPVSPPPSPGEPVLPAIPSLLATGSVGQIAGDMDHAHLSYGLNAVIIDGGDTFVDALDGDVGLRLTGFGFALDASGHLAGGTETAISYHYGAAHGGPFDMALTMTPPVALTSLAAYALSDSTISYYNAILSGSDRLFGSIGGDQLRGYGGADLLIGEGGQDTVWGGLGNDVIYAEAPNGFAFISGGSSYLRGEEGDDFILGGSGFDDANGNMGNDTISTGGGDDYAVGGKDDDLLFGDGGNDVVWGNLGNDTCVGGAGDDQCRGGQGDDVLWGGAGNDFISGDRGNDTETGGAGADIFHGSQDAGIDRVLDFKLSEGDRVQLDPGTTYTLSQAGADTVINMGAGNQMILVGVTLSTLTTGWIFGA